MSRTYFDGTRQRHATDGGYLVNLLQSPNERREKYQLLRALGVPEFQARRLRDWTIRNIDKWLYTNRLIPEAGDFRLMISEVCNVVS